MPTLKSHPPPPLMSSPAVVAAVNLSDPHERAAHDLLRRFCTGRWPIWRLLGLHRDGDTLHAAVEWRRGGTDCFSVVQIALDAQALRWKDASSAVAARSALARLVSQAVTNPATYACAAAS